MIIKLKKKFHVYLKNISDYTEADLAAVTGKTYYPSHITDVEHTDLTGYEEIFYKIGYLANSGTHAHFYGNAQKPSIIPIHDPNDAPTLSFTSNSATFYINVNYAPSQLEKYARSLSEGNRKAIFDYVFSVDLDVD